MHYATVSERLIALFDNNILQDILQHTDRVARRPTNNALMASLAFAEDYCLWDIFGGITPTIIIEANGGRPVETEGDLRKILRTHGDFPYKCGPGCEFHGIRHGRNN